MKVTAPNLQWYGDEPLNLEFPDDWEVTRCRMACEGQPSLSEKEIKAHLEAPLGTQPLSRLATKVKEVVIIIDDMTRPTRSHQYVTPILEILHGAGVPEENVRFIMASGSHGTYARLDFVKKLGEEIGGDYLCVNHNPYEYLDNLGETSYGTPVHVNSEVMGCDLKIGVGTVLYHRLMGMSGGGKIILPGVTGIESIEHNHGALGGFGPGLTPHPSTGYLRNDGNVMRLDAEEAARMAGLDFKVDSVLNLERKPMEVYAGDFVETQRHAVQGVMRWHKCEAPRDMDIVVANTYMRGNEAHIGMWPAYNSVKEDGTIVLMANDMNGEINHWIFGRHGKARGARLWSGGTRRPLARGRRVIICSPYKMRSYDMKIGLEDQTTWIREWEEVLEVLRSEYGSGSKVAVLPDATAGIPEKIWI
ncbi:MAG TPA: lactate racemase domain-containing protein [Patescibacteria group bacterium]|nr:lactate racemase domain-containing protein [Patescibacteria group bacterium]